MGRLPPRRDPRLAGIFDKLCIKVECKSQFQSTNNPNFISLLLEGGPTWSPAAGKRGVRKRAPLSPPADPQLGSAHFKAPCTALV